MSASESKELRREQVEAAAQRKSYHRPSLRVYGDLRDITLAPTLTATGESGRGLPYNWDL